MRTLVLVSLIGFGLAGAGAYLVSGRILAPVRLVRQTAAEITAQDLTRRIPARGRDDIAALAEQFDAMLDRLSAAFSTQRRFLDDAGHELKTPITIVRGHLQLMGDDPAERADVVRLVTEELDRMSRIVDDLLLLAKSERPDFVRMEKVSVAELTIDIHAKVCALGERRWLLESLGDGPAVLDPPRQWPHWPTTPSSTPARVPRYVSGQHVASTGRVGQRCRSGSPTPARVCGQRTPKRSSSGSPAGPSRPGAGLGLAIVRAIAEAHRGVVRLVSTPGQGARFSIELPATSPADRTSP